MCSHTHTYVPLLAAVPEAPIPAEHDVSGCPGSLPASHISEHTVNDSPSSKRRSQAPLTKTHKYVDMKKKKKKKEYFLLVKMHSGLVC